MSKKEPVAHVDLLGNELNVGDYVAASYFKSLAICQVTKLNPKMVGVKQVGKSWNKNVYPDEMIKIDPEQVTMYILRNKK